MADSDGMDLPLALDRASRRVGIDGLKLTQLEAIESFVSGKDGKDTFVFLPTGYGKSTILPLLFDLRLF